MRPLIAVVVWSAFATVQAQDKPAAEPPPPPSWQQGKPADSGRVHAASVRAAPHRQAGKELPVDKLKVPAGFKVEVWAEGVPEARSLALGDKGTVFVSNRNLKNVYAVVDQGGKREVKTLLKGLNAPNGIAFSKGTLYVAERDRITRYDGIEDRLDNPPEAKVVIDNLDPTKQPGHFWKFLAMGPDGKLYFNIGAPGNIVMPNYMQAIDLPRRSEDRHAGERTRRACATRSASTGIRRPSSCGSPSTAATGWATTSPNDTLQRGDAQGPALRLSLLPPGRHARSGVRQGPLVQGVHAARAQARRAHRAARHALLHRQDVPGRVPEQHLHRACTARGTAPSSRATT